MGPCMAGGITKNWLCLTVVLASSNSLIPAGMRVIQIVQVLEFREYT